MIDRSTTQGRVDVKRYLDLTEGHRTTLVVGMDDMLSTLDKYFSPETKTAFQPIMDYASKLKGGELRVAFDTYLRENSNAGSAIASNFLGMLIEKSGAARTRVE